MKVNGAITLREFITGSLDFDNGLAFMSFSEL